MSELLYTIKSIFETKDDSFLSVNKKEFFNIPLYQRGYKWTAVQVNKLLVDVSRFTPKEGKFYCVQNITLVPKENCFNVVDGQQRLTTSVLILSYLNNRNLVKGKLKFPKNSIRERTNQFIDKFITEDASEMFETKTWGNFIEEYPDYDHQDIYFLFNAYDEIRHWFAEKNTEEIKIFKDKFLNYVKFICNVVEGEKEEKIFGNLNSKRVYLDGADLIRAIIITGVTKEEHDEETIKGVVRINERRIRIGWELDHINRWWNQIDVKAYFEPWIRLGTEGDVNFNMDKHPINQLYSLYAESLGLEKLSLEQIETSESTISLYRDIKALHNVLVDWYNHTEMYHYLGFLFHQKSKQLSFISIWKYWNSSCKTKSDFSTYLLKKIKKELFGKESINKVFIRDKDWYTNHEDLTQILLFLDIIEALKHETRLDTGSFLKTSNDIEHIFPQTPEKEKDKREYLGYLIQVNPNILNDERISQNKIEEIEDEVLDIIIDEYTASITINSIGNLVLLYYRLNRSIQNSSYAYKRKRILDYYNKGHYIQPHTLKVFSRYFQSSESMQSDGKYWTQEDISENENSIKNTLINFFQIVVTDEEE
ncbi:DUF262 domain-containing protein [Zobellia nedashkovskayae]|uniref:DUF262 domain-containing protein n=1 Tax=Zobellia nedashkovskayae TaxID=2779510 RepID=UPI00188B2766|nr:DUF262 domain-containing protein [Zobellia nedashkovskayae]